MPREAEPMRQPRHVRVYHDADVDAKRISQNNVGSFASDTIELNQCFHRLRYLAAVLFHNITARGFDVARLVFVKTGRAGVIFQFRKVGIRIIRR